MFSPINIVIINDDDDDDNNNHHHYFTLPGEDETGLTLNRSPRFVRTLFPSPLPGLQEGGGGG